MRFEPEVVSLQTKEKLPRKETLYVVAEDLYFSSHTLIDLADDFARKGGKYLFVDEIHKYDLLVPIATFALCLFFTLIDTQDILVVFLQFYPLQR